VAYRQLRHEAAPTPPPSPPLAGTGGGVYVVECVCGNVGLVHFPTIAVGHGPGTHLAGLYNMRWLPLALTTLRQALAAFVSRAVNSVSVVCYETCGFQSQVDIKLILCAVLYFVKTIYILCLCVIYFWHQDAS
jgi:hypothetical protein